MLMAVNSGYGDDIAILIAITVMVATGKYEDDAIAITVIMIGCNNRCNFVLYLAITNKKTETSPCCTQNIFNVYIDQ